MSHQVATTPLSLSTATQHNGARTFAQCLDDNDSGGEAACPGVDGLEGARSLAVAPDGSAVYLVSFTDGALVRFDRDLGGVLSFAQCLDDDDLSFEAACPPVPSLALATAVAVSPDGKSIYVTADDAISRFDRELATVPGPGPGPDPAPARQPSLEAKAERSLVIEANKSKVEKGKKVTLTGQIEASASATACEASQSIEIQAKGHPDSAFEELATVQTDAGGTFTLKQRLKRTLIFRAEVFETAACHGALSNARKVRVEKAGQPGDLRCPRPPSGTWPGEGPRQPISRIRGRYRTGRRRSWWPLVDARIHADGKVHVVHGDLRLGR